MVILRILCLSLLTLSACKKDFASTEFGSGSVKLQKPRAADVQRLQQSSSSDDQAIAECLKKWGETPFDTQDFQNYRKIAASVTVAGIGNAVNDTQSTSKPTLILISAAVNIGGSPTYTLPNPNGWYCFKVGVGVKTNLTINLHCKAKLADNQVGVGVNSSGGQNSVVGVHVGSNVNIRRTGC